MSNQVLDDINLLHPVLKDISSRIKIDIIQKYSMPFKLFETGRTHERHQTLLSKGRTQNMFSKHVFSLEGDIPLYSEAMDYVFYDGRWSWNLRDNTIKSWYELFGNLVLDCCNEIKWGGTSRKSMNYTHFELKENVIIENIEKYPCIMHLS